MQRSLQGKPTFPSAFPSGKCAGSTLWGKEAELKTVAWSLRQSHRGVWEEEFGTARAAKATRSKILERGACRKAKLKLCHLPLETPVDSQATFTLG